MTRTFLAVELPAPVKDALRRRIDQLAQQMPDVRWVNVASLHLTLAFLGELDDNRVAAASEAAETVARANQPFTLRLAGVGAFGSARSPRVLWVGLAGEQARFLSMQSALAAALESRGFPREARPFAPHLTLARIKARLADSSLDALARAQSQPAVDVAWQVDAIAVMKSELLRSGAPYTALARWPLAHP
jgi:RNA 2',3'-cyclic 3'-phosphodiesterase